MSRYQPVFKAEQLRTMWETMKARKDLLTPDLLSNSPSYRNQMFLISDIMSALEEYEDWLQNHWSAEYADPQSVIDDLKEKLDHRDYDPSVEDDGPLY